jgi:hypothetical protein
MTIIANSTDCSGIPGSHSNVTQPVYELRSLGGMLCTTCYGAALCVTMFVVTLAKGNHYPNVSLPLAHE